MQAKGKNRTQGASQEDRKNPKHRNPEKAISNGAANAAVSACNSLGFPAVVFEPKTATDILTLLGSHAHNYNDCADQLFKSYKKYCKVCGVVPNKSIETIAGVDQVRGIYNELKCLIQQENPEAEINIDVSGEDNDKYHFTVYHIYDYDLEVFSFPLAFLKLLDVRNSNLFRPMVWLYGYFLNRLQFSTWKSNGHLEWSHSVLLEQANEGVDEETANAYLQCYNDYDGDATKYLEIVNRNYREIKEELLEEIKSIKVSKRLQFLKQWMIDGFELLNSSERKSIHALEYEGVLIDYNSDYGDAVGLDRQFFLSWRTDDILTEQHIEGLNMDSNEFGSHTPTETFIINERVNSPYKHSKWPQELKGWMVQGVKAIESYLETERKPKQK
jgi:hypothetical protein